MLSKKMAVVYLAILLLVAASAGYFGYRYSPKKSIVSNAENNQNIKVVIDTSTPENAVPPYDQPATMSTSTRLAAEKSMSLESVKYSDLPTDFLKNISWHLPTDPGKLGLIVAEYIDPGCDGMGCPFFQDKNQTYYEIANFEYNNKPGKIIYTYINFPFEGGDEYYFLVYDGKTTLLSRASSELKDMDGLNKENFLVDRKLALPKLKYPETITSPAGVNLTFAKVLPLLNYGTLKNNNDKIIFEDKTWGKVYEQQTDHSLYVYLANGTPVSYQVKFLSAGKWNDGTIINVADYNNADPGHCGYGTYVRTVDPAQIDFAKDLIGAGKDDNGKTIFIFQDSNREELKKLYENYLSIVGRSDFSYEQFIAAKPIFFWQDGLDRMIEYKLTKFDINMAECGKPVIYLYPPQVTDVKVEIKPNGGLTKTDPLYFNGWQVRANPNGQLYNYQNGQNYPYLFWEGKTYDFVTPNYGFVLKQTEVGERMPQILARLGLNQQEIKDFLEFWQPRLEVKPFVFVTFIPQTEFEKLAPLSVSPQPDKIIRVFMDYTPLDKPIAVAEPFIQTPARSGFTVVEWGGRLHE